MDSALTAWDWTVVLLYIALMLGMSAWLARGQRGSRDYYLGGNRTGALPVALSTMATQCSTNSLLGAPAFVAFAAGGGLLWLQYELAVPFAMIFLMAFVFPVFRGLGIVSVYEFLELRYGPVARTVLSVVFQLLRAFATGVTVYGVSLVLEVSLGIPFAAAVLLLGAVTVLYDAMGGIRAVIWSDVVQVAVLFGAMLAAAGMILHLGGGLGPLLDAVESGRAQGVDFGRHGMGDGATFAFWPMLIGGFFLYIAYYGCDQTQAQRELATRSVADTRRALFYDGLFRFPLVLTYCLLGLFLGGYAAIHPGFLDSPHLIDGTGERNLNLAVPAFVFEYFPVGLVGLVVAGLFAAAMSSLDSTINSLSALSMEDVVKRWRKKPLSPFGELWISRALTLLWGSLCLGFAFFVGGVAETVIEAVNRISSFMNGPMLAVFLLGIFTRRIGQTAALAGFSAGLLGNSWLWHAAPGVSWLWWNVTGFAAAWVVAEIVQFIRRGDPKSTARTFDAMAFLRSENTKPDAGQWKPMAWGLAAYGVLIFFLLLFAQRLLTGG